MEFSGVTFNPALDQDRLESLLRRVWHFMASGDWKTLKAIAEATHGSEASVSARLRDFRKLGYVVERRRVTSGLWEYRLVINPTIKFDGDGQGAFL